MTIMFNGQRWLFGSAIEERFKVFHQENPHVYLKLKELAIFAKEGGARRIGIALLFERLRWFSLFETTGDKYKLNNNYRSLYARKLMENEPELEDLFETRRGTSVF